MPFLSVVVDLVPRYSDAIIPIRQNKRIDSPSLVTKSDVGFHGAGLHRNVFVFRLSSFVFRLSSFVFRLRSFVTTQGYRICRIFKD